MLVAVNGNEFKSILDFDGSQLPELILHGVNLQTTGVGKQRNGVHQLNYFYTMVSPINFDFKSHNKMSA